jgi:hypothetical protein
LGESIQAKNKKTRIAFRKPIPRILFASFLLQESEYVSFIDIRQVELELFNVKAESIQANSKISNSCSRHPKIAKQVAFTVVDTKYTSLKV